MYTGSAGFKASTASTQYLYDGNGNQTKDNNKTTTTAWNLLNLPQLLTFSNGNTIAYVYDASGTKLRKVTVLGGIAVNTEYANGIEFDNYVDNASNITFIQTSEGRARKGSTKYVYEYDLKDHLGNTRVTVSPDPNDATEKTPKILQEDNYYAFGYTIQSTEGITNPKNEYLYNGKELQEETGLYDYGARLYDPVIGRWTGIDPLADLSENWSPYYYVYNNPIKLIDPDGMWTQTDDGWSLDNPGEIKQLAQGILTAIANGGTYAFSDSQDDSEAFRLVTEGGNTNLTQIFYYPVEKVVYSNQNVAQQKIY